ncbi:5'-methylthioadenosine/S-adenosylhomocysteine nucleosidase [Amycolatopsis sp. DSM 110486]|uniref:5'-methylthioadenosine/S-adenosylhomocysteine nucleosidase family protein n=1 Tax=Amycolatopsis sp. DSM 110486 TaxID=2865832 RepID=UPI001C6A5E92|nr:5'-methylthioadenosine/S-adenosylhomocysteine nucleosidase [Amycolatopsis sp. DSM 110486]QYN22941.1 5'-methylthioadenosine/S-adenosylhomocysteine nucleosidase [Amycolatopsis sp. DSM 110486]
MIVILTALDIEHGAVRARMTGVEQRSHRAGTLFDVGTLDDWPGCTVALAVTGMGNITAAALAERAVAEFSPAAILFVGVAGSLREWLQLGDVIVADKVYAYQGGRSVDEGLLSRPRAWELSHRADQIARSLKRDGTWSRSLSAESQGNTPRVHLGPIAAGDVVLDSRLSDVAELLRKNYNDAVAVEMESAGLALAGHLNENIPAVTIRGISDHAGGEKELTDREGWQGPASRNAAAFAVALAAALDDGRDGEGRAKEEPAVPPSPSPTMIARDNARVGQQIGINHGTTNFGGGQW